MKTISAVDIPKINLNSSVTTVSSDNKGALEGGAAAPFVDLYELLEVSPSSNVETLRKRIAQVYVEAQQNVDHRNFRKRFYYQELLEVYLPQARHLLLDPQRRVEYDQQLTAFHEGKYEGHALEFRYDPGDNLSQIPTQEVPEEVPETEIPQQSSTLSTPDSIATAPTHSTPNSGVAPPNTSTASAPELVALEELARRPIAHITVDAPPPAQPRPIIHSGPRRELPANARLDPAIVERRREHRRRELIQRELEGAGLFWGLASGAALVAGIGAFLILIGPSLPGVPNTPLGMPRVAFNVIFFGLLLGGGILAARNILRSTRRRIVAELSRIPYEQLLKRCERG